MPAGPGDYLDAVVNRGLHGHEPVIGDGRRQVDGRDSDAERRAETGRVGTARNWSQRNGFGGLNLSRIRQMEHRPLARVTKSVTTDRLDALSRGSWNR
jgi:hypothetical protein